MKRGKALNNTKPRVQIEKCFVLGDKLYGYPKDHPNPHGLVSNLEMVRTSRIVKHHSTRCIETENTIYEVLDWQIPEQTLKPPILEVG